MSNVEWVVILKPLVLFVGASAFYTLVKLAYRIWRSHDGEYETNRLRSGGLSDPWFGKVRAVSGGYRDYRVQAGLAVDKATNTWIQQGVLSEEAVDAVLQPRGPRSQ